MKDIYYLEWKEKAEQTPEDKNAKLFIERVLTKRHEQNPGRLSHAANVASAGFRIASSCRRAS